MEEAVLKRRLSDRGLQATDGWLDACIKFFKDSNEQYTAKELEDFVFDQWLLVDLRDLKLASFPPNLADKRKIVLTSQYTCQIESMLDIGHSAYSQHQKMSKKDTTNLEVDTEADTFQKKWEPKSSRTLMLYICDGMQELRAMEFKPVTVLNTSIIPGTKAIIKGPVLCRRGIIMLEDGKISLLGGEVDKLIIPNAYENILAAVLELPLNPDPYNLGANNGEQPPAGEQQSGNAQPTRATTPEVNRGVPAAVPLPNAVQQAAPNQRIQAAVPQSSSQQYQSTEEDFPDDEALLDIDLDFEAEFQNQHNVQISGGGATSDGLDREQPRPNTTSTRPDKQPTKTSSNVSWNPEPKFRNQQGPRTLGESAANIQRNSKAKQNSINSYLSARTPSNVKQDLKSNQNQRNPSYGASTSNAARYYAPTPELSPKFAIEEDDEDMLLAVSLIDSDISCTTSSIHVDTAKPSTSRSEPKEDAVRQQKNDFDEDDDICILDEDIDDAVLWSIASAQVEERTANSSHNAPARHSSQSDNISSSPFVYTVHVKDILGRIRQKKRTRVKAFIVKVTEKISVSNGEWRLGVEITDGSANLPVRFSSELVSNIFEMTPAELSAWKKAGAHDPAKKAELKKHFERGQAKLLNINNIFEIDLIPDQGARVVNIHELTADHVTELQKRSLPN